MLSEFKAFIAKGNVMELAVAVIIGGAFSGIVKSLTDEIIMPVVGAIFGNIDFSDRYIVLAGEVAPGTPLAAAREAGANVLGLGAFVSVVINFVILAAIIFLLVRYATKITAQFAKQEEEAVPGPVGPTEVELLTEIRDALRK
ncbi:large conductance mechanosensitive channel protein MscL [Erythrobacter sp.]|uniref:large conductance mechanosensitive channel protein MscL n=1 Tax=Erythrobacter sp. TaxID=1042 RepID=UPI0025FE98B8|nr:large conductance mechanosensitive channel protein MscL [Erythrobacter sp.]